MNATAVQVQRFDDIALYFRYFSNQLTTTRLQTAGRPTESCFKNVSTTIWSENLLWILFLIKCLDHVRSVRCARRSSGIVNLAVSAQSEVCFSDRPFWASRVVSFELCEQVKTFIEESTLYTSIILRWSQVSQKKLVSFHFQFRYKFPDKSTLYSIKIFSILFDRFSVHTALFERL